MQAVGGHTVNGRGGVVGSGSTQAADRPSRSPWHRARLTPPRGRCTPRAAGDSKYRAGTPHALGVCRLVVTGFWRVVRSLDGMGSSDRNEHRARRRERERQRRQAPKRTSPDAGSDPAGDMHASERRTAATACGWCGGTITPGRRDLSPSGARPPAGTGPGNRPGPRPPDCPRWRSSSGASRFSCLSCPPAVTGPACSTSSSAN